MKTKQYFIYAIMCFIFLAHANAQLGGLMKKAKEKLNGTPATTNNQNSNTETNTNANNAPEASSLMANYQTKLTNLNPIHKKYINKTVLSNKPIILGQENEADFKTEFGPNEKIYGAVYFRDGINDFLPEYVVGRYLKMYIMHQASNQYIGNYPNAFHCLTAGNENFNFLPNEVTQDRIDKNMSAFTFELIADDKTATTIFPIYFADMMAKGNLTNGVNALSLRMGSMNEGVDFKIDLSGVNIPKMKTDAQTYTKAATMALVNARVLPNAWDKNNSKGFKDPALTDANVRKHIKEKVQECTAIVKLKYGMNTGDPDWTVHKNEYEIPEFKYTAAALFVYKTAEGSCFFSRIWFKKMYEGGGNYGEVITIIEPFPDNEMNCANVK
jgi:hypothetical protein